MTRMLFSLCCKKVGPSRAGGDQRRPRRAVPVRPQGLTGIDSRARPKGGPEGPCPLGRKALRASTAERDRKAAPKGRAR